MHIILIKRMTMKKLFLGFIFAGLLCSATAFGYQQTETHTVREKLTIDTVSYSNGSYITPKKELYKGKDCRSASSIDVSRNICGCQVTAKPIKVKTYTEVIDHYQLYKPVITYKPAGTYKVRRIIK